MKIICFLSVFLSVNTAFATIDSIGEVKIPYMPAQAQQSFDNLADNWDETYNNVKMFCMASSFYWDSYSSSPLPAYERLVEPFRIPVYPSESGQETVQINALYDGNIKVTTNWEEFDNYVQEGADNDVWVHEPRFVVDVSAYNQNSKAGRLQALTMAKLAIISLHYNLAIGGYRLFRLDVDIEGLPRDQDEFIKDGFSRVYANTQWPYSGSSPLAQTYYKELIAEDFCPETLTKAESFAN